MSKTCKINFGSDLILDGERQGIAKGLKYSWVAHANADLPEAIFINQNSFWFKLGSKRMIHHLRRIISHETLHNILWYEIGIENMNVHDVALRKFKRKMKKECPKTYNDYSVI